MTIKKITNDRLLKGLGHIYKRLNDRFDRLESLIDALDRKLEYQIDSVKCDLDDLNELVTTNSETISAGISALRIAQTRATPPKQNNRDRLQPRTRQMQRPVRLGRSR